MRNLLFAGSFLIPCLLASTAEAVPIPVGISGGTLAIHYNAGMPEIPANQAYIKAQFSETNTNGGAFSFLPPFAPIFGDVGQFGIDIVAELPSHDGSLVVPFITPVDYDGVGPVPTPPPLGPPSGFALNDYKPGPPGPITPANVPFNSLFRGTGVDITSFIVTPTMTGFLLDIEGELTTDGLIHWFDPAAGTTALADVGLLDFFNFEGSFSYTTATDTTDGIDYYTGEAVFFANTAAVPEPSSAFLLFLGATGFAGFRYRRKEQAV